MSADPKVSNSTIGNAHIAIDCEDLGCLGPVTVNVGQTTLDLGCDWGEGIVGTLRGNPSAEINIEAKNVDAARLKWALDASTSVKAGDYAVTCLKVTSIDWTEDGGTYTATVDLHSANIDNVEVFSDSTCLASWEGAATPLSVVSVDECTGTVSLSTNDSEEALTTLYFTFDYMVDLEDGVTSLDADFPTFPSDFSVVLWHLNKTTQTYQVMVFWRCQSVIDLSLVFSDYDATTVMTVPIKLRVLSVADVHPTRKLFGYWEDVEDLPAFLEAIAI